MGLEDEMPGVGRQRAPEANVWSASITDASIGSQ
jgi:hypothetical protein